MTLNDQDLRRSLHLTDDDGVDVPAVLHGVDRRIARRRRARLAGMAVGAALVVIAVPTAVGAVRDRSASNVVIATTPTPSPRTLDQNLALMASAIPFDLRVPTDPRARLKTEVNPEPDLVGPSATVELKYDTPAGEVHVWQTNMSPSDGWAHKDPVRQPGSDVVLAGQTWRRVTLPGAGMAYATRFEDGVTFEIAGKAGADALVRDFIASLRVLPRGSDAGPQNPTAEERAAGRVLTTRSVHGTVIAPPPVGATPTVSRAQAWAALRNTTGAMDNANESWVLLAEYSADHPAEDPGTDGIDVKPIYQQRLVWVLFQFRVPGNGAPAFGPPCSPAQSCPPRRSAAFMDVITAVDAQSGEVIGGQVVGYPK